MQNDKFIPCGGCGAEHPNERCIGCFHDFGELAVAQSRFAELEQRAQRLAARWRMLTSELDKSVVETDPRGSVRRSLWGCSQYPASGAHDRH